MKNVLEYLEKLSSEKLEFSKRGDSPTIKTTQRNQIKKDIETAFLLDLNEMVKNADLELISEKTGEGLILGLSHDDLLKVKNASGEIAFEINIKVKNLDYDIVNEQIAFETEQAEKEQAKLEREKDKAWKKQQDEKMRAEKKAKAKESE